MKTQIQEQLKAVASNIRERRLVLGYTEQFMASNLSISLKSYIRMEKAHMRISIINLFRIAEILDLQASTLVSMPAKKLAYPAIHPYTSPHRNHDNLKLHQLL
jgi:transcriptional regulator with XRE-family HTH domain